MRERTIALALSLLLALPSSAALALRQGIEGIQSGLEERLRSTAGLEEAA